MSALRRIGFGVALALTIALYTSCSDATGPESLVTVVVTSVIGPSYFEDSAAGYQLIQCELTLIANNRTNRNAGWMDAFFSFYAPNSATPFTVDTVPAATIRTSWGADSIPPDSSQNARWQLTSSIPFTLKMRFTYQVAGGPLASSEVSVPCKPPIPRGPPPTITTLQDLSDTEPSDTLHVNYAATSTVGLWQTLIQVSGPCEAAVLLPEHLELSVTHDVALPLPASCSLGIPVQVTATSYDLGLQETSRSLTLPALVDLKGPRVSVSIHTPYNDWAGADRFSGYLFTGDTLTVNIAATDNHAIRRIYWELLPMGLRDSLLVNDSAVFRTISIPVQPSWLGSIQLQVYGTDVSGNVGDTVASRPGAIQVGPTVGPPPTMTSISGDVTEVAFDSKRGVIYLLQSNTDQIAVFSPVSLSVLRTIPLPAYALGLDFSPSGDSLITGLLNWGAIAVVDLTQASPTVATVPLAPLDSTYRVLNLRLTSTGRALIAVQNTNGGAKRLYTYDLASGALQLRLETPDLGYEAGGLMARSADGRVVVVNGQAGAFLRYDAVADTFATAVTARIQNSQPSVDSTAAHVAVSGDLYDASLQYVRSVDVAPGVDAPDAISADGQTHYTALAPGYLQTGIVRSRVSDGSIIDHIVAPLIIQLMRVSPDGSMLVVVQSCCGDTRIGLVNLTQLP